MKKLLHLIRFLHELLLNKYVLRKYSEPVRFTCEAHVEWGMKFSSRIITNIFYNNKQKIATDTVRIGVVSGFESRQRFK